MDRIVHSDLAGFLFDVVKAEPDWALVGATPWTVRLVTLFALGSCHRLAAAQANGTGLRIASLYKSDGHLAHAALFDPRSGVAHDVLGSRHVGEFRRELVDAVGPLRIALEDPDDYPVDAAERGALVAIACGLPWMPRPEGTGLTAFGDVRLLVDDYAARFGTPRP